MTHYVNSESIFSVIGDYPVVDQYDILYSNLQAGSTYDNYITGSLLAKVNVLGRTVYVQGERGLAFSKLAVHRDARPSELLTSQKTSYNLQPWRERAGTIRNVKLFSTDERFFDSLTPSLIETFKKLDGQIFKLDYSAFSLGEHNVVVFDNDPFNPFEEIVGASPIGFEASFPFEPMFSGIKRNKTIAESFSSKMEWTPPSTMSSVAEFKTRNLLIIELNSGSNFAWVAPAGNPAPYSNDANFWLGDLRYTLFGNGTPAIDTSNILFGFGDRSSIKIKVSPTTALSYVVGRKNLVERRLTANVAPLYYFSLSPIIRGWKYGLIDGNPCYTSCLYRRDRYGQFRDMLEQRLNSAFYTDESNSPLKYSMGVEQPAVSGELPVRSTFSSVNSSQIASMPSLDSVINEPPIRVNFTRQAYIENTRELVYYSEKPENTWSSNLSQHATSSLPYFDDISRNRNQTTIHHGSTILSSLSDLFGNTTIG